MFPFCRRSFGRILIRFIEPFGTSYLGRRCGRPWGVKFRSVLVQFPSSSEGKPIGCRLELAFSKTARLAQNTFSKPYECGLSNPDGDGPHHHPSVVTVVTLEVSCKSVITANYPLSNSNPFDQFTLIQIAKKNTHTKHSSLTPVYSSTLTPMHLRKAKLMFFWVRYPSSAVLKMYFPDIKFNKNNTAQLVKWFSNFR